MSRSILIMAGGTGGHIFPALAVAEILRAWGWKVTWLGAPGSMEEELVPQHGFEMELIRFSGLRGKGLLRKLALPLNLSIALIQSAYAMFRVRPDVVLGMGGYITFPGGLMAALLRRPLLIHEQNSIAGLSNKMLAGIAQQVLTGFPGVLQKATWCGNPVRSEIATLPEPEQRYATRNGKLNVLVVGGSLGAQAINEAVPEALAMMDADSRPLVTHQTGKRHLDAVRQHYKQMGVQAEIVPFMNDMAGQYARADLVICRAGALTVAELAAAGVASVLIPFPYAVDDHQTGNAKFLSQHGAALLLNQSELAPARLAAMLKELDRKQLMLMARQARNVAKADAALDVAKICKTMAEA